MEINEIVKELKENASIIALLEKLGHHPVPRRGREIMFHSMLRDGDTSPSFSVNDQLGVWFDHGAGKGGNIIDFGLAYWKGLKFTEVIEKIRETLNSGPLPQKVFRSQKTAKTPNYIVHQVKPIGGHPVINSYLMGRGIFDVARPHLSEVYYYIEDEKGARKNFFSAGWRNEQGAWEVRNRLFKGCMGQKAISFIPGHPKNLAVFEGFFDFLSWKLEHPRDDHSIIVLNSVVLWQQGVSKAKAFSSIDLYFDRDPTGTLTTRDFLKALPYATDRSMVYNGFNDYNDKIQGINKTNEERSQPDIFKDVRVPFKR